jgi:hypothetical protein
VFIDPQVYTDQVPYVSGVEVAPCGAPARTSVRVPAGGGRPSHHRSSLFRRPPRSCTRTRARDCWRGLQPGSVVAVLVAFIGAMTFCARLMAKREFRRGAHPPDRHAQPPNPRGNRGSVTQDLEPDNGRPPRGCGLRRDARKSTHHDADTRLDLGTAGLGAIRGGRYTKFTPGL